MEHSHEQLRTLMAQYYEQVEALQQTVEALQEQLVTVPKSISHYDLVQSDLLHELELMPLNAIQGTKVLQQLKIVRKERRLYKNMHLFSQQEQKNLAAIAAIKVCASPFETAKTYTYRTAEGYALHQSLKAERKQQTTPPVKPPKEQLDEQVKALDTVIEGYHIVRDNKQWQLFEGDTFIIAHRQLSLMHSYLEEHNIQVKSVSKHKELFTHYILS